MNCVSVDKNSYKTHLDYNDRSQLVSNTLLNLLSSLSPKLDHTLPAMLIGNIITSALKNHAPNSTAAQPGCTFAGLQGIDDK